MRWPRVRFPAVIPNASTGRTFEPWSATIQRTGRAKRSTPLQCIVLGKWSP